MSEPMATFQPPDEATLERQFRIAKGNWRDFDLPLGDVMSIAESWGALIGPIERPWLCWNVEPDWCTVQQKLVARAGWTPLVGYDPRVGPPPLIDGAVLVNFNEQLQLPTLRPMFVVEFAFLFARKLAFWHSDMLLDERRMLNYARMFAAIPDGEMAAVYSPRGGVKRYLPFRHRYWELLGCTTRAASRHQFEVGCGWWYHFYDHPNFRQSLFFRADRWDYGHGIRYWEKHCSGKVRSIKLLDVQDGHFSRRRSKTYLSKEANHWFRDLNADLSRNFSLKDCAERVNIKHLYDI
jgi:hypothetical protein